MTPEMIMAVLGAGGLAAIIPKLVDGIRAWQTGKANQERHDNRTALGQLERERDYRFRLEDWASGLVYMLTQLGIPADKIPTKPARHAKETAQ